MSNLWHPRIRSKAGFSLIEVISVIGIIALLFALAVPAFNAINRGTQFSSVVGQLSGTLDQARSYAMASSTYVYVGILEEDAFKSRSSSSPADDGVGRVIVAVVASKDGARGYPISNSLPSDVAWSNYNKGSNLVAISKLIKLEGLHLVPALPNPADGPMNRRSANSDSIVGSPDCKSATPFSWPLGTDLGAGKYYFTKVIQFDPQGVARIQSSTSADNIVPTLELALQQTQGNVAPNVPSGENRGSIAAVQINGITGAVRIFRP